ncbi:phenylalanine ammonia-lyase [Pseudovirgaria hyperparasitica]|uniref:Phenylalanine ammonia-lyase n=1 Tax=Pseudovirgaria hyperparasitica TaxID=470096 RepID=A0A6A6WGN2_9PEZI|nr:phenylalanine ammonia-lyase [Pseudovirgaria hyperparasitica]KAF2760797.1 phenylalanine ammonia-lyase [Pseudovirgaria hyperparasitica]
MPTFNSFSSLTVAHWAHLKRALKEGPIALSGRNITVADVIAVSRYGQKAHLDQASIAAINKSSALVETLLANGEVIYGVNTGFGGSADTRTEHVYQLQDNLIEFLRFGLVPEELQMRRPNAAQEPSTSVLRPSVSMPETWVKATMLVRANSLASGASGIRVTTLETLLSLLNEDITPIIPMRGSISASGDLSPLAYIGAALQGRSNAIVRVKKGKSRYLKSAKAALKSSNISPIQLGPKEGLAIVNGTAVSASVGALAMHEAILLSNLAQMLTAMSVEALAGTDESFDPFIARVRPHPGQISVANTIRHCLQGSQLLSNSHASNNTLRQDRYSIRTAPQWLGPIVEDIQLAFSQISIELNSITDNPLLDTDTARVLHGGNFQAKSVTSAMEKVRQACESIGRMLFTQTTELINPSTNRGLPPNLVIDEPSTSLIWKGTDILVAALQSELGFLASSVASHVQTAEMGNQSLNSLALIACRYTLDALAVLAQMIAAALVALCQALDIRSMDLRFRAALEPLFKSHLQRLVFAPIDITVAAAEEIHQAAWSAFQARLVAGMSLDSPERFRGAAQATLPVLLDALGPHHVQSAQILQEWTTSCAAFSLAEFVRVREEHFDSPDTVEYLGLGSRRLYGFVRRTCGVPFLRNKSLAEVVVDKGVAGVVARGERAGVEEKEEDREESSIRAPTMGGLIGDVFERIVDGSVWDVVVDCVREVDEDAKSRARNSKL